MLVRLIIILFIMLCVPDLGAQSVLKLPNIFASGMVLQQKDTVKKERNDTPSTN